MEQDAETSQMASILLLIAKNISSALDRAIPNETIQSCGLAPLQIISTRPEAVLELAHERLQNWPYEKVPVHWRRLYEDASLHLVVNDLTTAARTENAAKHTSCQEEYEKKIGLLAKVVRGLDGALIVAGSPGRSVLIQHVLEQLKPVVEEVVGKNDPEILNALPPPPLHTKHQILHVHDLDFEQFQQHLDTDAAPIIVPQAFEHWPARKRWKDVSYLRQRSLCGLRIIPVEVGTSYTAEDWGQKLMTFNDFANEFLTPDEPAHIGYLAQHDMFAQIPALKEDITIPDYCWATPRPPTGDAAKTPGLANTYPLDEPNLNAWLGPTGTKTPLHTDPYHNIFCQVVGYKYVRLYPPEEREKLYPCEPDAAGIKMDNTSQVDIFPFRPGREMFMTQVHEKFQEQKFPLFKEAQYQEAILAPGECLYVPLGWWHYVEALTTSFSVSFWWN